MEDDTESFSQLPPPMSSCFTSTSLLTARSATDVTSASGHVTQPADAGTSPQPAARPTTLLVTYLLMLLKINYWELVQIIVWLTKAGRSLPSFVRTADSLNSLGRSSRLCSQDICCRCGVRAFDRAWPTYFRFFARYKFVTYLFTYLLTATLSRCSLCVTFQYLSA